VQQAELQPNATRHCDERMKRSLVERAEPTGIYEEPLVEQSLTEQSSQVVTQQDEQ
jgi:hypothetical protein